MEPKEKARELVDRCYAELPDPKHLEIGQKMVAKLLALITVNEIIEALEYNEWQNKDWLGYYDEVKQEINKI